MTRFLGNSLCLYPKLAGATTASIFAETPLQLICTLLPVVFDDPTLSSLVASHFTAFKFWVAHLTLVLATVRLLLKSDIQHVVRVIE